MGTLIRPVSCVDSAQKTASSHEVCKKTAINHQHHQQQQKKTISFEEKMGQCGWEHREATYDAAVGG